MSRPYLSVCAIYRDEAEYLREWIAFHLVVGVERFFLYDNGSVDNHREALAPYLEQGIATIREWLVFPGQGLAYKHCLEEHGEGSRWIAFIDIDEFLFSPTGRLLPEVLTDYEEWPGVGVNRVTFGTSGHRTKPPRLVTESYVRRMHERHPMSIKSIVDPMRVLRVGNPHYFQYRAGLAVDENREPIEGWFTRSMRFSRLRINHYWTKSEEECRRKFARIRPGHPAIPWPGRPDQERHARVNEVLDETILGYVPALREALRRR